MTKDEVLQGALALNGDDKNYTVTVEDSKIIIQTKYRASMRRTGVFQCIAHLNDDNTFVETHFANDGRRMEFGKVVKVQKTILISFGGRNGTIEAEKETFSSEDIKKVLRDYLEACGYKRTNKGFFKRLFGR